MNLVKMMLNNKIKKAVMFAADNEAGRNELLFIRVIRYAN
jgi:hypothetical protein